MSHLYELTGQLKELSKIEDADPQALADTFEALEGEFEDKATALVKFTQNIDADIAQVSQMIKTLQDRKKVLTNRKEGWREYLRINMEGADIKKIECPFFAIILKNGAQVVVIDDQEILPDEYVDVEMVIKPKKKEILDALKAGEEIPGAHLETGKSSLMVK